MLWRGSLVGIFYKEEVSDMPIYEYRCPACEEEFERVLKFDQYKDPQDCPVCGVVANKLVSETSFVLKGDGWPGKEMRVKGQMATRRKKIGTKEKDHVSPKGGLALAPNVEGERTESWSDAQKLAASKGKDASSYEPVVQKEKQAR
jgi:putative FmdB family regulatory protein